MILMAWWNWFLPTTHWYSLRVTALTGSWWLGPRKMSENEATNWHADAVESNWGAQVEMFRWDGIRWRPAYS